MRVLFLACCCNVPLALLSCFSHVATIILILFMLLPHSSCNITCVFLMLLACSFHIDTSLFLHYYCLCFCHVVVSLFSHCYIIILTLLHCVFSVDAMFLLHYCLCFSHIVISFFSHCCLCSSCITTMLFLHYYFTFLTLLPLFFLHCCFIFLKLLPLFFFELLPYSSHITIYVFLAFLPHSFHIVTLHITINFQVLISTTFDVDILTLLLFLFPIWFSISPPMCKLEFKHQGSNTKGEFFKVFFHFFYEHFVLFILIMC